jgi:regulator of sigma E protease
MNVVSFFNSAWAFVLVLGVIVFVHEFGHFITAKAFGMRVFIFSFGFGRRLVGFKWGDTDCRLSLVPLGGYVKLEGEPDDQLSENATSDVQALSDGELVRVSGPNDFTNRPRWQRILVYLAGPAMNAVLTITVMTAFYLVGLGLTSSRPLIGVVEPDSPAAQAELRTGDEIVSLDGTKMGSWEDLSVYLSSRPNADVRLGVRRAGQEREVRVKLQARHNDELRMDLGYLGAWQPVLVGEATEGFPAQLAGVRVDDLLLEVGGRPMRTFADLVAAVEGSQGAALAVKVLRAGQPLDFQVTPTLQGKTYKVGIAPKALLERKEGFVPAFSAALAWTWQQTRITFDTLWRLVTFQLSAKSLAGPLGIAKAAGQAADQGLETVFFLIAFLSLQVGILNLMPIAPLDGGHLAILLLESVRRRDLSLRAKEWVMNAGLVMVLLLVVVVFYSDLSKVSFLRKYLP